LVVEGRTDLSEAEVMHRAMEYFAGELGMDMVSSVSRAVSFEGDGRAANLTAHDDGPDVTFQLSAEGLDEEAASEFVRRIEGRTTGS
jgi:hypothetical protein